MRTMFLIYFAFIGISVMGGEAERYYKKYSKAYLSSIEKEDNKLEEAKKTREKNVEKITKQYIGILDKILTMYTKEGNLDAALKVRQEKEKLEKLLQAGKPVSASMPNDADESKIKNSFLSDLDEFDAFVGYGTFGKAGNLGWNNLKIMIGNQPSEKSLSMHPPSNGFSRVSYKLDGRYQWLHFRPGFNDTSKRSSTPITFKVIGDGKELWSSNPLVKNDDGKDTKVDVKSVKVLRLEVHCPGSYSYAHAVWVAPRLTK